MIYLIGGCPRTGKSTIAKYLLDEHKISGASVDMLTRTLKKVAKIEVLETSDFEHFQERCDAVFPYLKMFIDTATKVYEDYVIEGCDFTPKQAFEIKEELKDVRIIFLGFSNINKKTQEKFLHEKSWLKDASEEKINELSDTYLKMSRFYKEECKKYGLYYIEITDGTLDFKDIIWN